MTNAGWYPDPAGAPDTYRYWDGQAWTGHVAPAGGSLVPQPPGTVTPYAVAPKSPGVSLLASFFVPGLGSMINGEVGKGFGILAGYAISWVLSLVLIGIPFLLGFWIWGMVDAYQGAQRWNARHGIIS